VIAVEKRLLSPLQEPSSVEKLFEVDSHIGDILFIYRPPVGNIDPRMGPTQRWSLETRFGHQGHWVPVIQ